MCNSNQQVSLEAKVNLLNVTMENNNLNSDGSSISPPVPSPTESLEESLPPQSPRHDTVIPNRIFVGGLNYMVNESDLVQFFSRYGEIRRVKIVVDRCGMSKGYGFVTFVSQEVVLKVLNDANAIFIHNKRLRIGQAFHKQQFPRQTRSSPVSSFQPPAPVPHGVLVHRTSAGCPYFYQNGMAYFHCPTLNQPPQQWQQPSTAETPLQSEFVYQQQHYQYVPNRHQWNVAQPQLPSGPVVFAPGGRFPVPANHWSSDGAYPVHPRVPRFPSAAGLVAISSEGMDESPPSSV